SLSDWRTSITSLANVSTGTLTRDAVREKLTDAQVATEQLITDLKDIGPPETASGTQLKQQLQQSGDEREQSYEDLKSGAQGTLARNLQVPVANGLSGAEVARQVLDANGLHDVPIEEVQGALSDHYDPRNRSVHLSSDVYRGRSIASTAVGAHEVGHAIQHAQAYAFFRFRSALFPAVSFASNIWFLFLI